ncbi:MAG: T9SS type A sorting domain-containing protein [Bacteroidales bacterium]|nr:T9SS type A sorting domain-containing protein [Bacteroidales bacterium]
MKKTIILMFILSHILSNFSMAQRSNYYNIMDNNYNDIKISYTIDVQQLQVQNLKTERGTFSCITYEGMTPMQNEGRPELPVITNLLEIPLCEGMDVNVINSTYEEYDLSELGINYPIMPVQPKHPKSEDGPFPFVIDEATYASNSFYGTTLAQSEKVGVLRNINMGSLSISPFEYNPVTGQLRVCTHLDVEISFVNANIPQTMEMKTKYGNGMFDGQHCGVINPMSTPSFRDEIDNAPIKYLIVAHSMFRNDENLQSFINWKKRIGYLVEIAYTDDSNVGTSTTSIKNFIKAKYDNATPENPAPTFVLLIGDVAQIPAFTGVSDNSHVTDLYYATWTTGDNIPDCYYGRFSAQNISQLLPQIEKSLMYEQYTMPDPSYLDDAVLVAGTDGSYGPTHANGQINYLSGNYVNTAYGFSTVYTHLYNSSSQAATIRSEIGAGVGYANYTAHCSSSGWSDPVFENNHVNSMNNLNKYGIMIGNCCLSGKFDDNSCFGETLLRAAKKGAVIYLGASNSTYWDQDYYWSVGVRSNINANPTYNASNLGAYDRMFHTHNEAHNQWYTTAAGFNMAGNLAVQSSNSSSNYKLYYWEIYHVFGDPSIKPYLSEPSVMSLNIPTGSVIGSSNLQINAVPYAYVALTQNNALVAAAFADANGSANLTLPSDMIPGQYEIAISAQNYVQFFQTITFTSPNNFYAVSDINLSNNDVIRNNHVNDWNLSVENVSGVSGNNVWVKIEPNSDNIYFTADSVYIGNMTGNQTVNLSNAFTSRTSAGMSNNEVVSVHVTVHSNSGTFERNFNFNAEAPILQVENVVINAGTVNVGTINPGESGTLTFTVKNAGQNNIGNLAASLVSHHTDITVNNGTVNVGSIAANGTTEVSFNISVNTQASVGSLYPFLFSINNDEYELSMPYYMIIGKAMEDFESNGFTTFAWNNTAQYPWEITTNNVYAGSYSARSKTNLPNGSSSWWGGNNSNSDLTITLNVTEASPISYFRKVSSESGYDFFSFAIDGNTMEELSGEVSWEQVSFDVTPGNHTFRFRYSKDGSQTSGSDCAWIDNIIFPTSGATMAPTSPLLVIDHYDIEGTYAGNIVLNGNQPVIKVVFNNEGNTIASNIQATLSTDNNNININGNSGSDVVNYNSMAIGSSKTATYNITNLSPVTETQNVLFNFTLTSGSTSTACPIMLTYVNGNNPSPYGIESTESQNITLLVYPNPSSDQVNIQCSTVIKDIEIIDITGRCVRHAFNVNQNSHSLNISSLSPAIYFIRVIDENDRPLISKIIKK